MILKKLPTPVLFLPKIQCFVTTNHASNIRTGHAICNHQSAQREQSGQVMYASCTKTHPCHETILENPFKDIDDACIQSVFAIQV